MQDKLSSSQKICSLSLARSLTLVITIGRGNLLQWLFLGWSKSRRDDEGISSLVALIRSISVLVDSSLEQDDESLSDDEGVRRLIVPPSTLTDNKNRVLGPNQTIQKKNATVTSALPIASRQEQRRPMIHSSQTTDPIMLTLHPLFLIDCDCFSQKIMMY